MPNPTPSSLYVSRPLTAIMSRYLQTQTAYIASRVFPIVPVTDRTGTYRTFRRGDWLRSPDMNNLRRAPGAESRGTGWEIDETPLYAAHVYALHQDLDDQTAAENNTGVDLDGATTEFVTQQMLLGREVQWRDTYFTPGVWTNELTGAAATPGAGEFLQWNDDAATPVRDIRAQATLQEETTGFRPNVLVAGQRVIDALIEHPTIEERLQYTRGVDRMTEGELARLIGVDEILIPRGVHNTAPKGAADDVSYIYGNHALLAYRAPNPSLVLPSAGYIFAWTAYHGAGFEGNRVRKFRLERNASDRIEVEMAYDMAKVSTDLAVFFADAIA